MHHREFLNRSASVITTQTAVLLAAKWAVCQIIDRRIVDVGHASLHSQRKLGAALDVTRRDCTR
jgi:hypothetical protein